MQKRRQRVKHRTPPPVAKTRRGKPASDETLPDVSIPDFGTGDSTLERTIPSIPASLEDTQVDVAVPNSDVVINAARQRPRAPLPAGESVLPRLSAILDKRSAG